VKKKSRRKPRSPEGKKISKLVREEHMPQDQAVATALSMKRAGRLTSSGGYIRAYKKKSKRRDHK
jgi:hypothetical protein